MNQINLKQARDLVGLSQLELDRRAGIRKGTTYDLEAGRIERPAHDLVVRIVRALQRSGLAGITADQLFPVPEPSQQVSE